MDQDLTDVEELTLCTFCKQKFNTTDLCPKILQCKHYFCLKCIETTMVKGREVFCVHCWKRTEVSDSGAIALQTHSPILSLTNHLTSLHDKDVGENCHIHGMPHSMWCHTCRKALCRACVMRAEHPNHVLKTQIEAKDLLVNEVQLELNSVNKMLLEIQRLGIHQREFLLRVLEACVTLKTCVESDLQVGCGSTPELSDAKDILLRAKAGLLQLNTPSDAHNIQTSLSAEKQRLEAKYHEMLLQCKLDELIGSSGVVLDFQLLNQALSNIQSSEWILPRSSPALNNPILFLTNYCMSQLYSRYVISKSQSPFELLHTPKLHTPTDLYVPNKFDLINDNIKADLVHNGCFLPLKSKLELSPPITILRNPVANHPMYFFNIDMNQAFLGRIVIETRPDVAPKMVKNFAALCTGETGVSYKNCTVFQCWEGESIITGDYESNNGRGGRSIYEEGFFMPDETKIPSVRGAVGMRRTQKRHDNLGMVGSQFRVILQEMRGFTAIFGHVVEGLDVIEKIASCGDQTGKPTKAIIITNCGKL